MSFNHRTIKVNGEEVEVHLDEELDITDISTDMDKVASQMGYWGSVWAAAIREQTLADAYYRAWRAQTASKVLQDDPKAPEWKVKNAIESDPKFLALKQAIAKAEENVTLAKSTFDSFAKKANTLQSKGAMSRSELDATGLHTPVEPRKKAKRAADDERKSAMRDAFKKKK